MAASDSSLLEEKKSFWRFKHAQQCFEHVSKTCAQVLAEKWPNDHPLIYQIGVSVVVLYARPFSNCWGIGRLSEDVIPPEQLIAHRRLLALRDKIFAHHDTTAFNDPSISDLRAEVRVSYFPPEARVEILEVTLPLPAFSSMKIVADTLEKKCRWHIERLGKKYFKSLKPGVYYLELTDSSDAFFAKKPNRASEAQPQR